MSFAPPRKPKTVVVTSSYTQRKGEATERDAQSLPTQRHAASTCFTPSCVAVRGRMRQYVESIRQQRATQEKVPLSTSCSRSRHTALRGAWTRKESPAPSHSPRRRGKGAVESGTAFGAPLHEFSKMRPGALRQQTTSMRTEAFRRSLSSPHASLPVVDPQHHHSSPYPHHRASDGSAAESRGDDGDEDGVSNPYIRSVLRGAEQRWIPPSLVQTPFNYRSRSQGLLEYDKEHTSYLSRRDLVREWKNKIRRSPDMKENQLARRVRGASDAEGKHCEEERDPKGLYTLGSPGPGYWPGALMPPSSMQAGSLSECTDRSPEKRWEYLQALQSLGRQQGIEEGGGVRPTFDISNAERDGQVLAGPKSDLNPCYCDDGEDPRAYLYAPLPSIDSSSEKRGFGVASTVITAAPVAVSMPQQENADFPLYLHSTNRVCTSELTLECEGGTVATAPAESKLHQQGTVSFADTPSGAVPLSDNPDDGVANYLIAQETEIVDTFGRVWAVASVPSIGKVCSHNESFPAVNAPRG